ncbi:MAG: DNA/RNA non-specific endonuclease, partial [Rhabdochlamydiaceae bacterium]
MTFTPVFSKMIRVLAGLIILGSCVHRKDVQQPSHVSSKTSSTFQPESPLNLQRQGYVLAYDGRIRGASWVYEELTASSLVSKVHRSHFNFMEDPNIPTHLRSTKEDFKGSGYDRGHLRPAANAKSNAETMKDTFYLSNISPQNPQLNRKYWAKLEKYVRDLTKSHDIVYVITGPLFMPKKETNGKRYVHY